MTKRSQGVSWMSAADYGRSLRGMGVNLLVREVARSVSYLTSVLDLDEVYSDLDFAVLRHQEQDIMLHADHSYSDHPMAAMTGDNALRGVGIELRLYDLDPDAAEARARARGADVLAESRDKPHGLRECYLIDPDGYIWVPSRGLQP